MNMHDLVFVGGVMKRGRMWLVVGIVVAMAGCSGVQPPTMQMRAGTRSGPLTTRNMDAVKGQKATCGGAAEKTFNIDVIEQNVELGMGTSFAAWTYNGRIPAPTLEACEGDKVTINVTNKGTTAHGLDSPALKDDDDRQDSRHPRRVHVSLRVRPGDGFPHQERNPRSNDCLSAQ